MTDNQNNPSPAEPPAEGRASVSWHTSSPVSRRLLTYVQDVIETRTTPHPDADAGKLARLIVTAVLLDIGAPLKEAAGAVSAASNQSDISLWTDCPDRECPLVHEFDPEGVRRHELPDDHPIVVSMRATERQRWAEEGRTGP